MATLASLAVNLIAQTSRFTQPLRSAERAVGSFVQTTERAADRVQKFSDSLDGITGTARRATLALTAIATISTSTSVSFDRSMAQVRAVSGATVEQFRALRAEAERLGAETKFSAKQVADGMTFLAMAGMDVEKILGASQRVTRLAAAANLDLASSADIVTNVMAGYRMEVDQLDRAIDSLTKAFTSSNVDLRMLGESLKYVGPVAATANVEFEELVATIGLLGNVGIQGSEAGTALRRAISILIAPTNSQARAMERLGLVTRDAEGNFVGLANILTQLEQIGADTADIMTIFEQRAGSAMAALIGSSDQLRNFTQVLREAGGWAEQVAAVQLEGFQGQLVIFQSQVEGARIAIGRGLTPALSVMVGWLQAGTQAFLDLEPEQRQSIIRWAAIAGAVMAGVSALTIFSRILVASLGVLRGFGMAASLAFSPLILKLVAVGTLATLAITHFDELKQWWENSSFGQIVRNAWKDLEETWLSDELTLPQKTLKTVRIVVKSVAALVDSIKNWWVKQTISLAKTIAVLLLPEDHSIIKLLEKLEEIWDNTGTSTWEKVVQSIRLIPGGTPIADFMERLRAIWNSKELTFKEKVVKSLELIPGSRIITDFVERLRSSWIGQQVEMYIDARIKLVGAMYEAIKKGLETGDWADVFDVGADIWRTGVQIATTLYLAAGAASSLISAIQTGLGLITVGLTSLGVPGAIGAMSIAVMLAEAQATGDYRKFGADLIAALAAGIGIGMFTRSPRMGALAFTIVLNFELGSKIADWWEALTDTGALMDAFASPSWSDLQYMLRGQTPPLNTGGVNIPAPPIPVLPPAVTSDEVQRMIDQATGRTERGVTSVREAIRSLADEYSYLESRLPNESLEDFMLTLGLMESGLRNVENSLSSARGEFQMLEFSRREVEKILGQIDWSDTMERTRAAFEWLRVGIEEEFSTIAAAAERLGITIEESLHLWWVMGGPALSRAQSLDVVATHGVTAAEILRRRSLLGFQEGTPWTGYGPLDEVAGVVHKREAVIPWKVLKKGPAAVLEFLGAPGFQEGRFEGIFRVPDALRRGSTSEITATLVIPQTKMEQLFANLRQTIEAARDRFGSDERIAGVFDALLTGLGSLEGVVLVVERELQRLWDALGQTEETFSDIEAQTKEFMQSLLGDIEEAKRRAEEYAVVEAAVTSALDRMAARIENVNEGLGSFARSIKWDSKEGRLALDLASLMADSVAFLFDSVVDFFETRGKAAVPPAPDPGTDILGIADAFARYRDLDKNIQEREREIQNLRKQQQIIQERTLGGAAGGAAVGSLIGNLLLPGLGLLLGAGIGGFIGGSATKKAAVDAIGPKIQDIEDKIRDLEIRIQNARVDLINALNIAADDFAWSITGAFSAVTVDDFSERLGSGIRNQIRQAMVQVFVADILAPQIEELAKVIQGVFLEGQALDMEDLDARISDIVDVSSKLYDKFEELGLRVEDTTERFRSLTVNMPLGERVLQALRFQSQTLGIPSFAGGGVMPNDGLAYLHRGEVVLTPEQAGSLGGNVYELHFHLNAPIYGVDDLERTIEGIFEDIQARDGLRSASNPVALRVRR